METECQTIASKCNWQGWNDGLQLVEQLFLEHTRVATKSWLFVMTEPREHALEQSESAVGVARSRVSQK